MSSLMRSTVILNQKVFQLERDFIQKKKHFENFLSEYFEISRKAAQYLGGSFSVDGHKGFEMIPSVRNLFHDSAISCGTAHLVSVDNSYFKANFYSSYDEAFEDYLSLRSLKIEGPYPRIDNESLKLFLLSSFSERVAYEFERECQGFLESVLGADSVCDLADSIDVSSKKTELSEEFVFAFDITRMFQQNNVLFNSEIYFSENSESIITASYKNHADFEGVVFEEVLDIDNIREETFIFFKSIVETLTFSNSGSSLLFLSSAQVFMFYVKALIKAINYTYNTFLKLLSDIFDTLGSVVASGIKRSEEGNVASLDVLHQLSDSLELVRLKLIVLGNETKTNFN